MKIAQVTPLYEAVPPKLYGGTERVVAHLTDALVDLGHEVTLFASADARTKARLIPVRDQAIRLDPAPLKSDLAAHMTMLAEVMDRIDDFDVIHFHTDMIHFPMFRKYADKTLTTLHGRLDMKDLPQVYERWREFGLISISDDQRRPLAFANWKATVHHGMPAEQYKFSAKSQGYLAFLGRISPEKRPDRAIEIATKLGKRLKMAAKVDAADRVYYEEKIKPLIDGNPLIEFVGDTPVVAFKCGSTTEIIEDGATGYLVETMEQAIAAADRVGQLDREAVRARFELRFSATAMARRYLDVYGDLLAKRPFAEAPLDDVVTPLRPLDEPRSFAAAG
jgi:glycosyltransferase involved in cell wall biosynthesis